MGCQTASNTGHLCTGKRIVGLGCPLGNLKWGWAACWHHLMMPGWSGRPGRLQDNVQLCGVAYAEAVGGLVEIGGGGPGRDEWQRRAVLGSATAGWTHAD
jgi:hypothetical protein